MSTIDSRKPFTFFLEFLLTLVLFVVSTTIIVQVYIGSIRLYQENQNQRKAMLFAQNLIESGKDLSNYNRMLDETLKKEGTYFHIWSKPVETPYSHYVLIVEAEDKVIVEYEWVKS